MIRSTVRQSLALSLAMGALIAPFAVAQFTSAYSPPFHGQPCTEFAGWESFTNPDTLPNAPDDPTTTSPDAALVQLTPGAVITTAGNIDHLTQAPSFRITESVPGDALEVVLMVSINLNPYDWSTALLRYVDGGGMPQVVAPTTNAFLVHQMGHDERFVTWDLSGNPNTITAYSVEFGATNSFSTLDAVKLDTRFQCAPGVGYCFGDGSSLTCPCGTGAPGNGCPSSIAAAGAHLAATGVASVATDSLALVATSVPNGPGLYFQGTNMSDIAFGDGKLCTSTGIIRLGVAFAASGSSTWLGPIHVGGGTVAGDVRSYQLWYRDADPTYCSVLF